MPRSRRVLVNLNRRLGSTARHRRHRRLRGSRSRVAAPPSHDDANTSRPSMPLPSSRTRAANSGHQPIRANARCLAIGRCRSSTDTTHRTEGPPFCLPPSLRKLDTDAQASYGHRIRHNVTGKLKPMRSVAFAPDRLACAVAGTDVQEPRAGASVGRLQHTASALQKARPIAVHIAQSLTVLGSERGGLLGGRQILTANRLVAAPAKRIANQKDTCRTPSNPSPQQRPP